MKLALTVGRYFPAIGGAERVVQRVAEGLASLGHEVSVLTSGVRGQRTHNGVEISSFPVSGNAVRGIRGDAQALLDALAQLRPELVLNYAAQTWTTDTCMSLLDEPKGPRVVLAPCGFSALHEPAYQRYFDALGT